MKPSLAALAASAILVILPREALALEHGYHQYWKSGTGKTHVSVQLYNDDDYTVTCQVSGVVSDIPTYGRACVDRPVSNVVTVFPGQTRYALDTSNVFKRYNISCCRT